jgi:hypothetical protein
MRLAFGVARCLAIASLLFALAPCRAEEFVDDAWGRLFRATLLANEVRGTCSEVDPALGSDIDAAIAGLRDSHGAEVVAGHTATQRLAGAEGVGRIARTMAGGFTQRLQGKDTAGRRAECTAVVALLDAAASRSRHDLLEASFKTWFVKKQREERIDCAGLHETARALSRRLLANTQADGSPALDNQELRAEAKGAERAAGWCLQAQAVGAREHIEVPGNFLLIQETARAISLAAMPLLSGRDPAAAVAQGRERARRYVEPPPGSI